MSAPAALVCAKVMYPDDEDKYHLQEGEIDVKVEPDQQNEVKADDKKKHKDNAKRKYVNIRTFLVYPQYFCQGYKDTGPLRIELKFLLKLLRNRCVRTFASERLQLELQLVAK